jgi:hypothetical protein
MVILYVDESGDPGVGQHCSPHYILSGLLVNQNDWDKFLGRLKTFRKSLKEKYGLNQRTEIHASELIRLNKMDEYKKIFKTQRINILKEYVAEIPRIFDTGKIINVCLLKSDYKDTGEIQKIAWQRLIQRFDTYLKKIASDKGIIVSDDTDSLMLMKLHRKMRVYNPTPSHFSGFYNAPTDSIIEDIFMRSSQHSYFIQTVDVVSHLLYRKEFPKGSLRKFNLENQFRKLEPILLKEASQHDEFGIVRK